MRAPVALVLLLGLTACVTNKLAPGKTPANAASVNVQLAIEYMRLNKLAIARDFIERALSQDSSNASVQATAGLIYERLGEMPKAEHAFATAARLGRDDPSVINSYAGFLCRTNQPAQGEKLFVKVARNPLYQTPEVALVNAGVCVRNSGDNISAERYFRDALAIRPNYAEALLQLGGLLLDRDEAPEALLMVQRYVAVNPPSPEILWLGLRVERKLGDDSAAGEFARRLQSEFPGSEQARMLQSGLAR